LVRGLLPLQRGHSSSTLLAGLLTGLQRDLGSLQRALHVIVSFAVVPHFAMQGTHVRLGLLQLGTQLMDELLVMLQPLGLFEQMPVLCVTLGDAVGQPQSGLTVIQDNGFQLVLHLVQLQQQQLVFLAEVGQLAVGAAPAARAAWSALVWVWCASLSCISCAAMSCMAACWACAHSCEAASTSGCRSISRSAVSTRWRKACKA